MESQKLMENTKAESEIKPEDQAEVMSFLSEILKLGRTGRTPSGIAKAGEAFMRFAARVQEANGRGLVVDLAAIGLPAAVAERPEPERPRPEAVVHRAICY